MLPNKRWIRCDKFTSRTHGRSSKPHPQITKAIGIITSRQFLRIESLSCECRVRHDKRYIPNTFLLIIMHLFPGVDYSSQSRANLVRSILDVTRSTDLRQSSRYIPERIGFSKKCTCHEILDLDHENTRSMTLSGLLGYVLNGNPTGLSLSAVLSILLLCLCLCKRYI